MNYLQDDQPAFPEPATRVFHQPIGEELVVDLISATSSTAAQYRFSSVPFLHDVEIKIFASKYPVDHEEEVEAFKSYYLRAQAKFRDAFCRGISLGRFSGSRGELGADGRDGTTDTVGACICIVLRSQAAGNTNGLDEMSWAKALRIFRRTGKRQFNSHGEGRTDEEVGMWDTALHTLEPFGEGIYYGYISALMAI